MPMTMPAGCLTGCDNHAGIAPARTARRARRILRRDPSIELHRPHLQAPAVFPGRAHGGVVEALRIAGFDVDLDGDARARPGTEQADDLIDRAPMPGSSSACGSPHYGVPAIARLPEFHRPLRSRRVTAYLGIFYFLLPNPGNPPCNEPPRDSWRPQLLRGWSHEQASEVFPCIDLQVCLTGGPYAGSAGDSVLGHVMNLSA